MRDSVDWHPSPGELMDVLDGAPDHGLRAHVAGCAACRARLDEARQGLRLAADAEIPDPPPVYWEAFGRKLAGRLENEPTTWQRRRMAPALVAAAVCVMIVGTLLLGRRPKPTPTPHDTSLPQWSALPAGEDAGLMVLQAMDPTDEELGAAAGCLGVAECLAGLSEEESGALAEALRDDLAGGARMETEL